MKRITRSGALVPILIVIVLAFFAQRIISPPASGDEPTYSDFIASINSESEADEIASVEIKTSDNTIKVTKTDDTEYETGYPDFTQQTLVNTLEQQGVETTVAGKGGGGI